MYRITKKQWEEIERTGDTMYKLMVNDEFNKWHQAYVGFDLYQMQEFKAMNSAHGMMIYKFYPDGTYTYQCIGAPSKRQTITVK